MRAEGSLRLILNANLFDGMFAELASEKSVRFTCADPEKKWLTYLIRVFFIYILFFQNYFKINK